MEARAGESRRSFLVKGALAALGLTFGGLPRGLPGGLATPPALAAPQALAAAGVVPEPPLHNAGYWEFADWLQPAMDRLWSESQGAYTNDTRINACALMTHAIAAFEGHDGRARRDERARQLAARLCESPPFRAPRNGRPTAHSDPRSETQLHAPGMGGEHQPHRDSDMHLSIDPKVARALYYAWRARDQLQLPAGDGGRMVQCVASVARLALLSLPERAPQPDQLPRRAARLRRQHDRATRRFCAATTGASSSRFLEGAKRSVRPVADPEPRAELQLPPQPLPARRGEAEHRVGRVRQHRARRHLLLRAGAPQRDGADLRGPGAHAARLGRARAARVLDAQRLHELGHGPLPVPLAPVALLGVVAPGSAGDRQLEELRRRRRAPLGEAHVRPLARRCTSASPSAGTTTAASRAAACSG